MIRAILPCQARKYWQKVTLQDSLHDLHAQFSHEHHDTLKRFRLCRLLPAIFCFACGGKHGSLLSA